MFIQDVTNTATLIDGTAKNNEKIALLLLDELLQPLEVCLKLSKPISMMLVVLLLKTETTLTLTDVIGMTHCQHTPPSTAIENALALSLMNVTSNRKETTQAKYPTICSASTVNCSCFLGR
jgi:hypothetical protein